MMIMAVKNFRKSSAISVFYKVGEDENGKDIVKSQKFSKIKKDASDEALYEIGSAMTSLLEGEIQKIVKEDKGELVG